MTKSLMSASGSLGNCDGLPLSWGDPRRRDRWGGAVLRHAAEDLQSHEKQQLLFGSAFTAATGEKE